MAEPTLSQIHDMLVQVAQRLDEITLSVDLIRADLNQHRRDSEERSTVLDLGLRGELTVVRMHVDAFQPQLNEVRAQQTAGDLKVAELATKLEEVRSKADTIKADVALMNPKIDEVRSKQDRIIAQQGEPAN